MKKNDIISKIHSLLLPSLNDEQEQLFSYFEYSYSFIYSESVISSSYLQIELSLKEDETFIVFSINIDINGKLESDCSFCNKKISECEHCKILVTKVYNEHKDDLLENIAKLEKYEDNKVNLIKQKQFNKELSQLTERYNKYNNVVSGAKVHVIPFISTSRYSQTISFKIGYEKLYKVSSIQNVLNRIRNCDYHKYGTECGFTHYSNIFDNESQLLFSLLKNVSSYYLDDYIDNIIGCYENSYIYIDKIKYFVSDEELSFKFVIDNEYKIKIKLLENGNFSYLYNYGYDRDELVIKKITNNKYIKQLFNLLLEYNNFSVEENFVDFYYSYVVSSPKYFIVDQQIIDKTMLEKINIKAYFDYENSEIILTTKFFKNDIDITEKGCADILDRKIIDKYCSILNTYGFKDNKLTESGDIYRFISSSLDDLRGICEVYFSESLTNKNTSSFVSPQFRISREDSLLNVALYNSQFSDKELIAIYNAIKKKKKYILINDTFYNISNDDSETFAINIENFELITNDSIEEKKLPFYYLFKSVAKDNNKIDFDEFATNVFYDIKNYETKKINDLLINGKLRKYQENGIKWLSILYENNLSGILADDMGLGKTIEIIGFINNVKPTLPILIVTPKSLIFNWLNEFRKFATNKHVHAIIGSSIERYKIIDSIIDNNVYLISYDTLRNDYSKLSSVKFDMCILDEAQFIKNSLAKKTNAVKKIDALHKFALTGTPIENSIYDLWSIFDFLMPNYLYSFNKFKENLETNENFNAVVKKMTTPFILRRKKGDVLKDLPDKYEVYMSSCMSTEQRKIYDAYLLDMKNKLENATNKDTIQFLAFLTRLRQICVDPSLFIDNFSGESGKIQQLFEIINEKLSQGHRILIFSQFISIFEKIESFLNKNNYSFFKITGDTKAGERLSICEKFNNDYSHKIILISLKAGGTGLNLVGADTVIHLDPWWNIAVENQASDRAHRIGQTRNVEVIKLIAEDSIEDKVISIQNEKKQLISEIIAGDDSEIRKMSIDELKTLLW